jgi:hypothetical protein
MPELVLHSTLSPLDLTRYTEATRRELYDRVLRIQSVLDAGEPAPPFDPEAAGLTVVRWIDSKIRHRVFLRARSAGAR